MKRHKKNRAKNAQRGKYRQRRKQHNINAHAKRQQGKRLQKPPQSTRWLLYWRYVYWGVRVLPEIHDACKSIVELGACFGLW